MRFTEGLNKGLGKALELIGFSPTSCWWHKSFPLTTNKDYLNMLSMLPVFEIVSDPHFLNKKCFLKKEEWYNRLELDIHLGKGYD